MECYLHAPCVPEKLALAYGLVILLNAWALQEEEGTSIQLLDAMN